MMHSQVNLGASRSVSDGGAAFNKSSHSVWPVFVVICEIDPEIRYNPENVFFMGLPLFVHASNFLLFSLKINGNKSQ